MSLYLVGGCSSYQEINLEQVSFRNGNDDNYQFGIQLTTASSCHCVTILINAIGTFGTNLFGDTNHMHLWCNKSNVPRPPVQCFNQLCASETKNVIFSSRIITDDGTLRGPPPPGMIPNSLPISGDYSTGVCLEIFNTLLTTMFESSSLVAFLSSSSSFHTTVEDHKPIMATSTSHFPSLPSTDPTIPTLPSSYSTTHAPDLSTSFLLDENSMATSISYSLPYTITNKLSQSTTELMKIYTLPYSSPIPMPTLIYVSHTNGGVSQTSARPSLTSPGASPSPTMLFCSASENGTWPMTPACTNATSTECGNNSSHANG